jgi:hypothetical protein
MLFEDQYGVGDSVDLGDVSGSVEAVGLRITTIRDARGVLWYIRNGEIVRVGNRSQGWALVVVDVPVGFAGLDEATGVLATATASLADDPEFAADLLEPPEVLGVEQITVDGATVRTTAKTPSAAQWRVARDLRRRLTEALRAPASPRRHGESGPVRSPYSPKGLALTRAGPGAGPDVGSGPGGPRDAGAAEGPDVGRWFDPTECRTGVNLAFGPTLALSRGFANARTVSYRPLVHLTAAAVCPIE